MITGLKLIRWTGLSTRDILQCPLLFIDGALAVIWQARCVDRMVEMVVLDFGLDPRMFCPAMGCSLYKSAVEFDTRRGASAYHPALGLVSTVYTRMGWERRGRMNLVVPDVVAQSVLRWRAAREAKVIQPQTLAAPLAIAA